MSTLTLDNIIYSYADGTSNVLNGISYDFQPGNFYAIVGHSGAGKSTLLGLLAGLDEPTGGQILFDDQNIADRGYSYHRKHTISLVFQNYNLIDYLTPLENLKLVNPKATAETLRSMGLDDDHIRRSVLKLSGGQQQRVAIARALVSDAPIILADEPTGNLDEATASDIIATLRSAAHDNGKCVIVVTHSKQLAKAADVVLKLRNKKLTKGYGEKR